jgi:hypothetical protein
MNNPFVSMLEEDGNGKNLVWHAPLDWRNQKAL